MWDRHQLAVLVARQGMNANRVDDDCLVDDVVKRNDSRKRRRDRPSGEAHANRYARCGGATRRDQCDENKGAT